MWHSYGAPIAQLCDGVAAGSHHQRPVEGGDQCGQWGVTVVLWSAVSKWLAMSPGGPRSWLQGILKASGNRIAARSGHATEGAHGWIGREQPRTWPVI